MRPNGITDFWSRVDKSGECWLWTGSATSRGYGQFLMAGVSWATHRLSYTIHFGPVPDGLSVLHRCDVRRCVQPAHLFLGTTDDNMLDMVQKGRSPRGERNRTARLTDDTVREIRALYATGRFRQVDLAERFRVSQKTVSAVVLRRKWKHVE